jgi:UDP-hydrolysing UDP-N-acetyl-D-glucosamine 2-epimerase
MLKRKICVITGTRAEYGLLYWLMQEIRNDQKLQLQVVATGTHLSPEFGLTYKIIEEDGFHIDAKVEMLLSSDTPLGVTKSLGLGVIGFADVLERLKPDILVILGDRYEILAAAEAALIARIPIAHIAGGDVTEGAFDESIRHSITKMSHLHFVTNEVAYQRVKQMGENPKHIYNVGSPGIDYIAKLKLINKRELEKEIEFNFKKKNLLVTFHPETLVFESVQKQFYEVLKALDSFDHDIGIIFTKANADPGGRIINKMIDDYIVFHSNAKAYISLGQQFYLSVISQIDVVVGNSSSGLYEVPSFKKPTVNIGNRQKGRLQGQSIINCEPIAKEITKAINKAFVKDCSSISNLYGDGRSSKRIIAGLKQISDPTKLIKKHFFEVS